MFRKTWLRKSLWVLLWVLLSAGLFVAVDFFEKQHQLQLCNKLEVLIKYNSDDYLMTSDDVLNYLVAKKLKIKGAPLGDLDAGQIEDTIYTMPYVEKADVFITVDGDVNIKIVQKKPLVKVINKLGQTYYIDDKGHLMPPSNQYSARVTIANGFISDYYNPSTRLEVSDSAGKDTIVMNTSIYKVYRMAQFIQADEFWKAMVEEIFINNKGEIELFTELGAQTIVFGEIDNMKEKFSNLLVFYKQGLNKIGWDKYSTINLKYKNQVVCSNY